MLTEKQKQEIVCRVLSGESKNIANKKFQRITHGNINNGNFKIKKHSWVGGESTIELNRQSTPF